MGLFFGLPVVIAETVEPTATVESEASIVVSAGALLSLSAGAVPPSSGSPVVLPAAGLVQRKLRRRLARSESASFSGVAKPASALEDAPVVTAVSPPSPANMDDVVLVPAPASWGWVAYAVAVPVEENFIWSDTVAVTSKMVTGKKCIRLGCCARVGEYVPRVKRCVRRGGRCWRQGGCVEVRAVHRLPAAGHEAKRGPRAVVVRLLCRDAKKLLFARAAGIAAAAKKGRVVFAAFEAAKKL
ncbi:hypothetical protein [Parasitella parasitica]|uniref:Uncharacterized protein n=1 Tax=Parasitella parasitica TaxID=35722 RepID=A0A0B7NAD3_9FUNG|nr:hypothetical protein [Parasitella parasitica]